jgi:hypothetical protein
MMLGHNTSDAMWLPFLKHLTYCEQHVRDGGDQLEALSSALRATILFLETNPTVSHFELPLTRNLQVGLNVFVDILDGNKPALIFDRAPVDGTEDGGKRNGRPIEGTRVRIKGVVAGLYHLLRDAQIDRTEALGIIVKALKKYGIKYPNKSGAPHAIGVKQIQNWRSEMRKRKGHPRAMATFDDMVGDPERVRQTYRPDQTAKLVGDDLAALKSMGF